jgi:hypothetical protein
MHNVLGEQENSAGKLAARARLRRRHDSDIARHDPGSVGLRGESSILSGQ